MSAEVTDQEAVPPPLTEAERAAAFAQPEPKIPPRFFLIVAAVVAVLGIGGALLDHLLSGTGLSSDGTATPSTTSTPVSAFIAPPGSAPSTPEVGASLSDFMGIATLAGAPAPALSLTDQAGRNVSLADERGDAVVLTFFDSPCQDICPVLSAELVRAASDLGPATTKVVFLTVNTDPLALSATAASAAATRTGLGALANWHFLTSNLDTLNSVWQAYGVSINVSPTSALVAHNDVMYFIDPDGRLRYEATPFADESSSGAFSLPPASITRWAQGIATYARQLLGSRS